MPREFPLEPFKTYFLTNELNDPKPYWTALDYCKAEEVEEEESEMISNEDLLEITIENSSEIILEYEACIVESDFFDPSKERDPTCNTIDNWFDEIVASEKIKNQHNILKPNNLNIALMNCKSKWSSPIKKHRSTMLMN